MAISKEQLASIISGRAAQLCSPEGTRLIESHTGKQGIRGDFNNPDPSAYDDDAYAFDSMYLSTLDEGEERDIQYSNTTANNSRMPDHIKKSMLDFLISFNTFSSVKPCSLFSCKNNCILDLS